MGIACNLSSSLGTHYVFPRCKHDITFASCRLNDPLHEQEGFCDPPVEYLYCCLRREESRLGMYNFVGQVVDFFG